MANRHPTDPFLDGSLLESWTFEGDTLDSQQTGNAFISAGTNYFFDAIYGYRGLSIDWEGAVTTNPLSLSGDVDATVMARIKLNAGTANNECVVSFGEASQRYNIELAVNKDKDFYFYAHKRAVTLSKLNYIDTHATEYAHLCVVYDSATGDLTCYINGTNVGVINQATAWNNSKGVEYVQNWYGNTGEAGVTDIQYYNRKLSPTEINNIVDDSGFPANITVTPDSLLLTIVNPYTPFPLPARGLDPFEDGSLLSSFGCNYTLNNDQSTATLQNDADYEFVAVPYDRFGIQALVGNTSTILTPVPFSSDAEWSYQFTISALDLTNSGDRVEFFVGEYRFTIYSDKVNFGNSDNYQQDVLGDFTTDTTFTVTHNDTTDNTKFFFDGQKQYDVSTFQYSPIGANVSIDGYSYQGGLPKWQVDEILFFNRELTESEAIIANDNFVNLGASDVIVTPDSLLLTVTQLNKYEAVFPNSLLLNLTLLEPTIILNALMLSDVLDLSLTLNNHLSQGSLYDIVFPESSQLTVFNPLIYEGIEPDPIYFKLDINTPVILTQPVMVGGFPLLKLTLLEPTVYTLAPVVSPIPLDLNLTVLEPNVYAKNIETLSLKLEALEPYFADNLYMTFWASPIDLTLFPIQHIFIQADESPLLKVNVNLPDFFGEPEGVGGVDPYPNNIVFAQSLFMRLSPLYIKTAKHAFIYPKSLMLNISPIPVNEWVTILPTPIDLSLTITSSVAQPYRDKRVVSIGSVTFDKALYWTQNIFVNNYLLQSRKTVDGGSITSVLPMKQFSRGYEIQSKSDIIIKDNLITQLISQISENVVKIMFTDGSFEYAKFNLIKSPLTVEPTYEGSEYYYINIKVLI